MLAGLEPDVTERVLEIPALTELRKACAERLRAEQLAGTVRPDIDPVAIGNGIVAIMLSLLMSVVQLGPEAAGPYSADVAAVFEAALDRCTSMARTARWVAFAGTTSSGRRSSCSRTNRAAARTASCST